MANKSKSAGKINIVKNLVIGLLGLDEDDLFFGELFTLLSSNLKTGERMLSMKKNGVGNKQVCDCYKHFFARLLLWHL